MDVEVVPLLVLAVAGVAAGYVNTIAGAGSMLTLPALMFTGLDAGSANATNRIAILFQSAAATVAFRRAGVRVERTAALVLVPAAAGAVVGSLLASRLGDGELRAAIAIAMGVFLGLSFVKPGGAPAKPTGDVAVPKSPPTIAFRPTMWLGFALIGAYAGFLQAGVGILVLLYLSVGYGASLIAANALKSMVVAVLAVVSLTTFAAVDVPIDPIRGGTLAVATTLGGWLGARATLEKGERFVRVAVVLAILASIGKLAYDAAF